MHITICQLTLHENLYYATREVGRLYETGRYLHNYGLTFALGLASAPYFNHTAVPQYEENFAPLNAKGIYISPARPLHVEFELATFKYADNRYHLQMEQSSRNTPTFGRIKELATNSTFEFVLFAEEPIPVPNWIRLGKWMSKAALQVKYTVETVHLYQGEFTSAFPLNPLDLPAEAQLLTFDLISMPPVSLLDHAHLVGPYYRLDDGRTIPAGLAYRFPSTR